MFVCGLRQFEKKKKKKKKKNEGRKESRRKINDSSTNRREKGERETYSTVQNAVVEIGGGYPQSNVRTAIPLQRSVDCLIDCFAGTGRPSKRV